MFMKKIKDIIFLVGPTAVGKTRASIYLAKLLNAEIISCDSMQVYKGMDIGTQKPSKKELKAVRHHMVGMVTPSKNFSAAAFRKKAASCIRGIIKKKKTPLFVGGTGLYMKILIDGLFPSPKADMKLRAKLSKQEELNGRGFLHKRLSEIDPDTAKILHPHDTRRVIRALEIYYKTKKTMSELKKNTKGLSDKYDVKIFALNRDRDELYKRINMRVDAMFKQGFVAECKRLKKKKLSLTASQALGYKEIFDYLDGKISLKDAKDLIKQQTRNYAKRQLSWFRNDERVIWIDADGKTPSTVARDICKQTGIRKAE